MAKQVGFRLWIDRSGIESDGGTLSTSVNFAATQIPCREILTRLLHQYDLDYVIEEGVVVVDSLTHISERVWPAVYDTSSIPEAKNPIPLNQFLWLRNSRRSSHLIGLLSVHLDAWSNGDGGSLFGSSFQLTPSIMIARQSQRTQARIRRFLDELRQREPPIPEAAKQPDLKPEFLTRVYPVFDPEAIEPSVKILKLLLANHQLKLIEVVKESIVIQCSDEGHIRSEAYFEAIESAHRRRSDRIKPVAPTPIESP